MEGRILVVDDNPTNLKLACDVLEMVGYRISRAVDASTALDAVEREHPELILMDIELPGIDGLTLTRMIKGAPGTGSIAIVALTAFAMKGDDQKALDAGCDGYISKPIDTRSLPLFLAEILDRKRERQQAEGRA
jgi:CheY-like chemotaxis protein